MNIKVALADWLSEVCRQAGFQPVEVEVNIPQETKLGDLSTNLAFKLFSQLKDDKTKEMLLEQSKSNQRKLWQSPQEIANWLVGELINKLKREPTTYFAKIEAMGGFINFFLAPEFLVNEVNEIIANKQKYAASTKGQGQLVRVEFVSANPTGPLHIGNARGGPIGDVLSNVLTYSGYQVLREFFVNDVGGQVTKFGYALVWFAFGSAFFSQKLAESRVDGELEYKGKYMLDLAKKVKSKLLEKHKLEDLVQMALPDLARLMAQTGVDIQLHQILADLKAMGIKYDQVYFESDFASKSTSQVIAKLQKRHLVRQKEGATWFAPTNKPEFLLDKDSVLVKSNGELTYFANDIAYHNEKFKSQPALVIDVLGAGHHGHVARMKAAVAALGFDPDKLKFVLYQHVFLKEGKKKIKMAKRVGTIVTAAEVLKAIGKDAFRFFMLMHDAGTHLELDLSLAKKKAKENPVYYVQYAHARIASILDKASLYKVGPFEENLKLSHSAELALAKGLVKLPIIIEEIAESYAVHRLTYYSLEVADLFHKFYENCRVVERGTVNLARLRLVEATGIILRTVLEILGITAPLKM